MSTMLRMICATAGSLAFLFANATNLVPNPDFDDGLDGWTPAGTSGVMTLDSNIGFPTPPSLDLDADTINPNLGAGAYSACVAADDSTHYDFFMNADGGGAFGGVYGFSDEACSTLLAAVETEGVRSSGGTYALTDFLLPQGTHSARVILASVGPPLGTGDETLFDHILFGPTGTLLDGIDVDAEGFNGTWYDPMESGQGWQFVINPGATDADPGTLFGAWYTYDTDAGGVDSQRWYSIQGDVMPGSTTASFTVYQNTGGTFDAPPATSSVAIGTGTLAFASTQFGEFTYTLDDGRSGTIAINRLTVSPATTVWYDPTTSGQGFIIDLTQTRPAAEVTIFGGWYSYAPDGSADGNASEQRWFSLQGSEVMPGAPIPLTIYASTGGTFDSGATTVETDPVGTAMLTFEGCTSATLDYEFDDGELSGKTGSIALMQLDAEPGCGAPN